MFVLLYGYVFGSAMIVPGGVDYREFLMPGMFAQTMMFGAAATISVVVAADRARGVTDRFRSMPMAQPAVVLGRSTADMVNSVLDLAVLVGCGLLVGWSSKTGLLPTLAAFGLLLLLRFAMIWVGIHLGSWSARRRRAARGLCCSRLREHPAARVVWPVLIVAVFLPLAVRRYHATAG
jgi:ABC-2 type transport system permease protein